MTRRTAAASAIVLLLFAVLTVLVAGGWSPLLRLDRGVAVRTVVGDGGWADTWRVATDVLAPTVWRAVGLVVAVLLYRRGRTGDALRLVAAALVSLVLNYVVKQAVARPRPDVALEQVHGLSFPSAHAQAAGTLAVAFVLLVPAGHRVVTAVPAAVLVALTAASRLALGVHYLSDVTAGVLLGAGVTGAVFALRRPTRGVERGVLRP